MPSRLSPQQYVLGGRYSAFSVRKKKIVKQTKKKKKSQTGLNENGTKTDIYGGIKSDRLPNMAQPQWFLRTTTRLRVCSTLREHLCTRTRSSRQRPYAYTGLDLEGRRMFDGNSFSEVLDDTSTTQYGETAAGVKVFSPAEFTRVIDNNNCRPIATHFCIIF